MHAINAETDRAISSSQAKDTKSSSFLTHVRKELHVSRLSTLGLRSDNPYDGVSIVAELRL